MCICKNTGKLCPMKRWPRPLFRRKTVPLRCWWPGCCPPAGHGRKLPPAGTGRDDLVQEGFLGVMSAVRHYHPGLGEFTPYALTCARNSMGSAARAALSDRHQATAGLRPHSGGPPRRGGDPAAGAGGGRRIQRRTAPLDANRAYRLRAPSVPAVFGRLPLFGNSLSSFFSFQSCG